MLVIAVAWMLEGVQDIPYERILLLQRRELVLALVTAGRHGHADGGPGGIASSEPDERPHGSPHEKPANASSKAPKQRSDNERARITLHADRTVRLVGGMRALHAAAQGAVDLGHGLGERNRLGVRKRDLEVLREEEEVALGVDVAAGKAGQGGVVVKFGHGAVFPDELDGARAIVDDDLVYVVRTRAVDEPLGHAVVVDDYDAECFAAVHVRRGPEAVASALDDRVCGAARHGVGKGVRQLGAGGDREGDNSGTDDQLVEASGNRAFALPGEGDRLGVGIERDLPDVPGAGFGPLLDQVPLHIPSDDQQGVGVVIGTDGYTNVSEQSKSDVYQHTSIRVGTKEHDWVVLGIATGAIRINEIGVLPPLRGSRKKTGTERGDVRRVVHGLRTCSFREL